MNIDVEFHIRHNYPWSKLPANVRQVRPEPGAVLRPSVTCSPRLRGGGWLPPTDCGPYPHQGLGKTHPQSGSEEGTALGPPGRMGPLLNGVE